MAEDLGSNQRDASKESSRTPSSFGEDHRSAIQSRRYSTPPSLPSRNQKNARRSWLLGYNMDRASRPRSTMYGGDYSTSQTHTFTNSRSLHGFEDIPLEDIVPSQQQPPTARRNIRDSINRFSNRISLTPSEIPYPSFFAPNDFDDDPHKAEKILGLRPANPPPVPPKPAQISPPGTSSTGSLPQVNKILPPRPVAPLNGRVAWLHALTAILVVGNCWGVSNAFGLFQAYYTRYYIPGTPPSTVAWIGSTQLALVFGLGVPVGRLVDIGFFKSMFHGGTFLMLLGLFTSSVCEEFWSLWLTQGLITGLGMGMVFCSGILALMSWFDERKMGVAMGLGAAGSCIGGIAYVLLARHFLVEKGFATTMRIIGAVATGTMIPPNLVYRMRDQPHLRPQHKAKPSRSLNWRTFASRDYLFAAVGMFLTFLGVYFGFVYMVSFASEVLHLSDTASTNLLVYMLAANLPGRFVPALISDKCIGPLNTIIPAAFLSSAVVWLWTASSGHPNQASLTVVACFYGFVSAGVQVLYAPTVYTFCLEPGTGAADGEEAQLATDKMGVKAGGIFSCIGIACLIGTPIGGALITWRVEEHGTDQPYLGAQAFAGTCLLVGGLFLLMSRVAKIGWAAKRA